MRYCRSGQSALRIILGLIGVFELVTPEVAIAQPAQSTGAEKTADEYALEGRELASRDDMQGAYRAYIEAWKRKKSYDVAGNLGVAELRLGKARDAAEHLTFCEQNFPVMKDAEQTKKLETLRGLFREARAQVGGARIRVTTDDGRSAEGASVFVDGRRVGQADAGGGVEQPLGITGEVFVDAGSRRFAASLPGCQEGQAVLGIPKGGSVDVGVVIECRTKISIPLLAAGIGVTAAGIGVGIGTLVHSNARDKRADEVWFEIYGKDQDRGACNRPSKYEDLCAELESAHSDWQVYQGIAIGSFVVGGAAAVATVAYVLSRGTSKGKAEKPAIQAAFSAMPGGGGAVVWGSF